MSLWNSAIVFLLVSAAYCVAFFDEATIRRLTLEDGPVETLGAFFFLASAVLCFTIFRRNYKYGKNMGLKARREAITFLLGLFLLLCFLEEISWGQRYLGIETPEIVARNNRQGELNIHNLTLFHGVEKDGSRKSFLKLLINGDRLFSVFWLGFGVLVPLLSQFSRRARQYFAAIGLPVLPAVFSILFVANYVISKSIPIEGLRDHPWVEIKEANCAFLLMVGSIALLLKRPAESLPEPAPVQSPQEACVT